MKSKLLFLLPTLAIFGCNKQVGPADIAKINGYWEIEKVILPDGSTKEYPANTIIDFFEIKGNSGIRKKVTPQLDGSYTDNGAPENITVKFADRKAYLCYNSNYAKWQEEVIEANDDELVFKNESKLEYHYKKPIPFSKK